MNEKKIKSFERRLDEHKYWIQKLVTLHKKDFDKEEGKGKKK